LPDVGLLRKALCTVPNLEQDYRVVFDGEQNAMNAPAASVGRQYRRTKGQRDGRNTYSTGSGNENTGSRSTGRSNALSSAAFRSGGMASYFANHFSARSRSPKASISSSSLARLTSAAGMRP